MTELAAVDYRLSARGPRTPSVIDVMIRKDSSSLLHWTLSLGFAALLLGCEVGGVGDPCIPEDEYSEGFSGFSVEEVNVESKSFQCETRVCLVNHFKGRVSCPYGNPESTVNKETNSEMPGACFIPDSLDVRVSVPVDPQLADRPASDAVYCSCRCKGADENAKYCDCPSGFACVKLIDDLGIGPQQLAGSYCVREGTEFGTPERPVNLSNHCKYGCRNGDCDSTAAGSPRQVGNCGPVNAQGAPL